MRTLHEFMTAAARRAETTIVALSAETGIRTSRLERIERGDDEPRLEEVLRVLASIRARVYLTEQVSQADAPTVGNCPVSVDRLSLTFRLRPPLDAFLE